MSDVEKNVEDRRIQLEILKELRRIRWLIDFEMSEGDTDSWFGKERPE